MLGINIGLVCSRQCLKLYLALVSLHNKIPVTDGSQARDKAYNELMLNFFLTRTVRFFCKHFFVRTFSCIEYPHILCTCVENLPLLLEWRDLDFKTKTEPKRFSAVGLHSRWNWTFPKVRWPWSRSGTGEPRREFLQLNPDFQIQLA